jgi:threonine/homoserine/homoserine lactone efflux protein
MDPKLLAFFGIIVVLTLTPGADTALVTRNTLAGGRAAGILTACGVAVGCLVHATLSALGLSAILQASAEVYTLVKWAGAGYLIYLGLRALWEAGHISSDQPSVNETAATQHATGNTQQVIQNPAFKMQHFRQGLITNLLNPKVALFYLTFLPQFLNPGDPVLLKSVALAAVHSTLGIAWLALYSSFLARLSGWFLSARIRRRMEAITGGLLVTLGLGLAWERR